MSEYPLFSTENIAYWFFRINGCLNLVNFLVHHERRGHTGTDVDILAARFPFRRELEMSNRPMVDHPVFDSDGRIDLIIGEVKTGLCDLNGPWTDPDRQNMHRVLYAVGAFPEHRVPQVAHALYYDQVYEDDGYRVRLFAVGQRKNPRLSKAVVQLTWKEMLSFIHQRFTVYEDLKAQHEQWDPTGKTLFRKANGYRSQKSVFIVAVMRSMGLEVCDSELTHPSLDEGRQQSIFNDKDLEGGV